MDEFVLREICPSIEWHLIERIGELRTRAWRTEVEAVLSMTTWLEELASIARHWAILRDNFPVAAARLSLHSSMDDVPDSECYVGKFPITPPPPIASFSRLVV